MKITALKLQARDKNRVNVFVDGKYLFSLDLAQVADLGIKNGDVFNERELQGLIDESLFGKLYSRSLEYALNRPRSIKEMKDYLFRKTLDTRTKTGAIKKGVSTATTERVLERLIARGYVDDVAFANFWIENRNQRKGSSLRRLRSELSAKGVASGTIDQVIAESDRNDSQELVKIINKKASRYDDEKKLIAYLASQGFRYDDIKSALADINQD